MKWLRRYLCHLSGHQYTGAQSSPYLYHPVPTHCRRCDWTQGPFNEG